MKNGPNPIMQDSVRPFRARKNGGGMFQGASRHPLLSPMAPSGPVGIDSAVSPLTTSRSVAVDSPRGQLHSFLGFAQWARRDLNPGPRDYESPALTAELQARRVDGEKMEPVVGFEPTT